MRGDRQHGTSMPNPARRGAWWEHLMHDARFGARILWTAPEVSLTAVVLVALVIGGNTTIYSLVRMMLTSPAAGVTGEGLVAISPLRPTSSEPFLSYPDFVDAATSGAVEQPAGWTTERLTVTVDGVAHAAFGGLVTGGLFDALGVTAREGRVLTLADDRSASEGLVAVISERFWRDRLGSTSSVIGQRLLINGQPVTIVGVAARGFRGALLTPGEDLWVPLVPFHQAIHSEAVLADRSQPLVVAVGRLAEGHSRATAQARVSTLASQLAQRYPASHGDLKLVVSRYSATALLPIARMSGPFLAVFGTIMVVTLLVVSANVANLMLVRALARQRDVAVRQSLGASRGRIIRLVVMEGLTVALTAWLVAVAVAWGTSRLLIRSIGPGAGGATDDFAPDWTLVTYALVLAVVTTVAFTTMPALRTWRQPVGPWLKAGERSIAGGRSRAMRVLVVAQIACAVLLLTSAGLAYRSLALLDARDVGFDVNGLLAVTVRVGGSGVAADRAATPEERARSLTRLALAREQIQTDGRLTAVTYVRRLPGPYLNTPTPVQRSDGGGSTAIRRMVGPEYLTVLGVAPVLGRDIRASDTRERTKVAVINGHLATTLWPNSSPIGQRLQIGARESVEVVGVAPNVFFDGPLHDRRPQYVFVSELQNEGDPPADLTVLARHAVPVKEAADAIGAAVAAVDASTPIVAVATMADRLALVTQNEQAITRLLVAFAGLALLVAGLGLYAVAAFNARQRTREFGVRLALGATPQRIRHSVLGDTARLVVLGTALGCAASAVLAGLVGRALIGVSPTDPMTYAAVVLTLAVVSVSAAMLPAWQACRVNVVVALRQE